MGIIFKYIFCQSQMGNACNCYSETHEISHDANLNKDDGGLNT